MKQALCLSFVTCCLAVVGCADQESSSLDGRTRSAAATASTTYVGCYTDSATRALPTLLLSEHATVETCAAAALSAGLKYAGLQYGGECWAGNTLGIAATSDSDCNMKCWANTSETCGGSYRNSIYTTSSSSSSSGGSYIGCYTDGATRAFPTQLISEHATVESCIAAAGAAGYNYAGLQYGGECWAGNTLGFTVASDSDCNMKCWANTAETCGGSYRNSVYTATSGSSGSPAPTPTPTAPPAQSSSSSGPTPDPSYGARYYVDSAGGSDSASGTSTSAAWKTLAKVNTAKLSPGDVVAFKRGSYFYGHLVIQQSGTSAHPIFFTSYGSGALPVLDNQGSSSMPANVITFWNSASHVVIEQLYLTNTLVAGVEIDAGSTNNFVRNCEITNTGSGVSIGGTSNLVTGNNIHDLHMIVNDTSPNNDYGAVAINLSASDNEVSYNTIRRCRAPSYDYGYDGGAVELYGNVSRSYVHHNYVEDSDGFVEIGGESGNRAADNIFAYNVVVDSYGLAAININGAFGVTVSNTRIENNTIIKRIGTDDLVWFSTAPSGGELVFRNNLAVIAPNTALAHSGRSNFAHDHNLFWRTDGTNNLFDLTLAATDLNVDPKLVNLSGDDFHLQSGSPAIRAGTSLGYTATFDGNAPSSPPNIGAY